MVRPTSRITSSVNDFDKHKHISLTTFRKDGRAVSTPVWFARDGEALVVWTVVDAGKVKRIRRSGDVTVASCNRRGRLIGEPVSAHAVISDADESQRIRWIIAKRFGPVGWITMKMSEWRRGKTGTVGLRITL
jgi:uncharacterized protein